jgi:hypothetical protein
VYDITTRGTPAFVREQSLVTGVAFRKLLVLDATTLVAITADRTGGTGHDVVVIDATDVNALSVLSDFDVPQLDAFEGAVDGDMLYLAAGESGVAIVDLTNPASPDVDAVLDTPGVAHGVALSAANELAIADGNAVTFVDITNKSTPVIRGRQRTPGNATCVKTSGSAVWVATEQHLHRLQRP